jgi:hypothetical protein
MCGGLRSSGCGCTGGGRRGRREKRRCIEGEDVSSEFGGGSARKRFVSGHRFSDAKGRQGPSGFSSEACPRTLRLKPRSRFAP